MPSYLASSRIRKPGSAAPLRRHSTTPFSTSQRTKPSIQRTKSLADALKDDDSDKADQPRLVATSTRQSVIPNPTVTDVPSAINHATTTMFSTIPERAGMNSTRIAEVLNYQKATPPIVSLAHVHSLLAASSKIERQIDDLITAGTIRKIKFVALLQATPRAIFFVPSASIPQGHITVLTRAGFLVSASAYLNASTSPNQITRSAIVSTAAIARASSGSLSAVGGEAAFENLGGTGARSDSISTSSTPAMGPQLMLSLPGIGSYIRLLHSSRTHLLSLLSQSPYSEAPMSLLKERWDGAIDSSEGASSWTQGRNTRGVFSDILPGRTKKWKKFCGVRFEWVLEDALGAGMVEVFETGSVGLGVRAVR
ncbi:uncharacterized protein AB675_374 [Cyphellophora attinorum]|uniref:Serine-threonine protein kinase 19 n=1 Tax=Cyphellophora attinorum TaxID=1664694 RepID=A0A0N0NS84_9EURO|nr:uncharacterized protein AB675_374 [Phialophora attinorum]KPI45709.1 hypothetical protein AB675_374 [Phialophora attinorum]